MAKEHLSELALFSIEKALVKELEGRGSWWERRVDEVWNSVKKKKKKMFLQI